MKTVVLWLYRTLMAFAVLVAVPWLAITDRRQKKHRPSWASRFMRRVPDLPKGAVWIHAVSVGEVEVARRLVAELDSRQRKEKIVLTVTTATGLDLARSTLADRAAVIASPIDLPGPVRRFLEATDPKALVLVETELWPEMLHQVGRHRVPVLVINARLSEKSFRAYRRVRRLLSPLLRPITKVLGRDEADVERFRQLGIAADRVGIGGNIKYDLKKDDRPLEWQYILPDLASGRPVVVAGSTMDGEEAMILDALEQLEGSARPFMVLAPRHPERFDSVAALLEDRGFSTMRRSAVDHDCDPCSVFLIDTIGELARAYRFAEIAFIGGSLVPTGGHNPLEPAVWGVPVLTGPHLFNFEEVYRELIATGASRVVKDPQELAAAMAEWLADPAERHRLGKVGLEVVESNRGATATAADAVIGMLE